MAESNSKGTKCRVRLGLISAYLVIVLLFACTLTFGQVSAAPAQEWHAYGHDPGGMRFSPLQQINRSNVQRLQRAWTYELARTPNSGIVPFETTPLMVNDVLYFATPTGRAIALDAETGKRLWFFDPFRGAGAYARPVVNRGVAYWEGTSRVTCSGAGHGEDSRIFYVAPHARLFALDAATGVPCKNFGSGGGIDLRVGVASEWPKSQYEVTSPPAIYKNLVITGSEVQEYPSKGPSGAVRAFDVRTGKLVWTFNTVPKPGEAGHETWEGDSWKGRSGVNAWGPLSIDAEHGLLFMGIGAPSYDFYGADRKGKDLFSDSLVTLYAATGKLAWYYQTVHHDLWDIDLPSQPALVTLHHKGQEIPAVVVLSKTGFVFVFNRLTGKPLFPIEERPVPQSHLPGEATWPTQPFPPKSLRLSRISVTREDITTVTPESRKYCLETFGSILPGQVFNPWGLKLSLEMPGTLGGSNWWGASFDPSTGYLFANVNELGAVGEMSRQPAGYPEAYERGSRWGAYARFWDDHHNPCQQPPWGTLNAVNLNTGEVAWKVPLGVVNTLESKGITKTGVYNLGGSVATAGGLVFICATADYRFRAFDARTGKQLWVTRLEANGNATPMTYLGEKTRKQFVVIAVGPGYLSNNTLTPSALTAYTLFPKGQPSAAQLRLDKEIQGNQAVLTGPGSEPPTIASPLPAPNQPIPFSHKLHLGVGLKCDNCHVLSKDGKQMQIANVAECMVCHQAIGVASPAIQKLAQAQKENKKISWARVYQLPDFVFFSHRTHLDAKIGCAVCHGAVQEQAALRQEKDISMVSCVNCHKLYHAPVTCDTCHDIGY